MDSERLKKIKYIRKKLAENPQHKFTKKFTQDDIDEAMSYNKKVGRPPLSEEERAQHQRESRQRYYEKNKETLATKKTEKKQGEEPKHSGRPRLYTDEERAERMRAAQARYREKKKSSHSELNSGP